MCNKFFILLLALSNSFLVSVSNAQSPIYDVKVEDFLFNQAPEKKVPVMLNKFCKIMQQNNKWGIIEMGTQDIILPFIYDSIIDYTPQILKVKLNGKFGLINILGNKILNCEYDDIYFFGYSSRRLIVHKDTLVGLFSEKGKQIIPCKYSELMGDDSTKTIWFKQNNLWGLMDESGKILSPARFEYNGYFKDGVSWVRINGKSALLNTEGIMITPAEFEFPNEFSEGFALAESSANEYKRGFINTKGECVSGYIFDNASGFSENKAAVKIGDQWNYIDKNFKNLFPVNDCQYANKFKCGVAVVENLNGKFGLINNRGENIIPAEYDEIQEVQDSIMLIRQNDKWGYADVNGKIIIPCRFEEAENFYDGEALVKAGDKYYIDKKGNFKRAYQDYSVENPRNDFENSYSMLYINRNNQVINTEPKITSSIFYHNDFLPYKDSKWGFKNKEGKIVVACKYDSVGVFNEGVASVCYQNKWGYIYADGDTLIDYKYDYAYNFSNGIAIVKQNGKYGYINKIGETVIPCGFDKAYDFSDSLALVKLNNKFGYVNKLGEQKINFIFDDAMDFKEGVAAVMQNGKWGFINKSGNIIISCLYDAVGSFSSGLAVVEKNGLIGYIDKAGTTIIPMEYLWGSNFENKVAIVMDKEREVMLINKNAEIVMEGDFRSEFHNGLAVVANDEGKMGYVNTEGKMQIPFKYTNAFRFSENLAAVQLNNKWGFISTWGGEVIPSQYDEAFLFCDGVGVVLKKIQ